MGTRSYGPYPFHFAVLGPANAFIGREIGAHPAYGEDGAPWWMLLASLGVVLTLPCVMAELGYRLVERPLMRLRPQLR